MEGPAALNRSERKRTAIVDAARQVFLRKGYVGTSMDEIAAVAAVSKQTVYKHFVDKEALFHDLITTSVDDTTDRAVAAPPIVGAGPLEVDLRAFARHLLHGVMQPAVLQLRRLVIGEAVRFPSLGRAFHDLGLARTIDALTTAFAQLSADGQIVVDDAGVAAEHFTWLVLSTPLNRAMLLGDDHGYEPGDLDRWADAGVAAFLAAYGRR